MGATLGNVCVVQSQRLMRKDWLQASSAAQTDINVISTGGWWVALEGREPFVSEGD